MATLVRRHGQRDYANLGNSASALSRSIAALAASSQTLLVSRPDFSACSTAGNKEIAAEMYIRDQLAP